MNKNKEWLKSEVTMRISGDREKGPLIYVDIGLQQALDLINQLEEPGKVVIPDFVADFIKSFFLEGGNKWGLLGVVTNMTFSNVSIADKDLFDWLQSGNGNRFIDAVRNGYTVAKEKRYRLKLDLPIGLSKEPEFYLNEVTEKKEYFLSGESDTRFVKTIFTESELSQIDETGFVRVEVAE